MKSNFLFLLIFFYLNCYLNCCCSYSVALCFFGLTRSLYYTKKSISTHIFDILKDNGITKDIYLHTYNQTALSNPRSHEVNVTLDSEEWRLLKPDKYLIDDGELFKEQVIEYSLPILLTHGDPWKEGEPHTSLRNLITQLYSIHRVTNLWKHSGKKYDAIFYLRPDVWFFNDLNISDVFNILRSDANTNDIYVPEFHSWGGINDRFAFGSPNIMEIYGSRYLQVINYALKHTLHSESFLHSILLSNNATIKFTNILFERVRSNGILWGVPVGGQISNKLGAKYQLVKNILGEWTAESLKSQNQKKTQRNRLKNPHRPDK